MNILVLLKRIADTLEPKIDKENKKLIFENVDFINSGFDLYALELALRLKDKDKSNKVFVLSLDNINNTDILKDAIARGADDAKLIVVKEDINFRVKVRILAEFILNNYKDIDIILTGKNSSDELLAYTPAALAGYLNYPFIFNVHSIDVDNEKVQITRVNDSASTQDKFYVKLPAIFSVGKEVGDVRMPSLRGMMKAKRAKIDIIDYQKEVKVKKLHLEDIERIHYKKDMQILDGDSQQKADKIVEVLKELNLLKI